jgi:hypothetical protein
MFTMAEQSIGALALKIVNVWEWYQKALANPSAIGSSSLPVSEDTPKAGYYRVRRKDGPWEPVAIFYPEDSATLVAYRNGNEVRDINALWVWCCRNPVEFDAYEAAMEGKGWADEPTAAPGIGDNSGDADPFDALRIEYLGEKEQAEAFIKEKVTTQAQADKVGIWAKRLTAIKTKAEGLHKVEKQPHLDAGRAVDDKWRDLKTEPDELAKKLKAHIQPFLSAKLRAEQERARKAAEEADRLRREAQAAADAARTKASEQTVDEFNKAQEERADLLLRAQEAEKAAEVRNATAGRTGSKVGIRTEKVGVVTDYAKAAAALVAMRHKDIIETIDTLAKRAAKAGMPFDGMEIKEEERVV